MPANRSPDMSGLRSKLPSIHQDPSFKRFRSFERRQQPQKLTKIPRPLMKTRCFQFAHVIAQNQVEKIVIICGR